MGEIHHLQAEMAHWSFTNFPNTPFGIAALGTSEEMGEMAEIGARILDLVAQWGHASRAIVKGDQDIRGGKEKWLAQLPKELADCFIKICDVANRSNIDLEAAILDRWDVVSQRVAGSADEAKRGPEAGFDDTVVFLSGNSIVECALDGCLRLTDESSPHFPYCLQEHVDYAAQKETTQG
jgi:NTP pyrophosphatase (non-canonical NTP hydrolase)